MTTIKTVFYLPVRDNDGRLLAAERGELEWELDDAFDGWTKLGLVEGAYKMQDGTRVVDEHYAYSITMDETRLGELQRILTVFKARTLQEAIYLEVQQHVKLILV